MKLTQDFLPGPIADNIIHALQKCSAAKLLAMERDGVLRIKDNSLSPYSLIAAGLSRYSLESNVPARLFFYPNGNLPNYTGYDREVISVLNTIDIRALHHLEELIERLWPNEFFHLTDVPYAKLMRVFLRKEHLREVYYSDNLEERFPEQMDLLQRIMPVMEKIKKCRYSTRVRIDSNLLPDVAEFFGVSLHWVYEMEVPLFCTTQSAELIFDRYTLMQPHEQEMFRTALRQMNHSYGNYVLNLSEKEGR